MAVVVATSGAINSSCLVQLTYVVGVLAETSSFVHVSRRSLSCGYHKKLRNACHVNVLMKQMLLLGSAGRRDT